MHRLVGKSDSHLSLTTKGDIMSEMLTRTKDSAKITIPY